MNLISSKALAGLLGTARHDNRIEIILLEHGRNAVITRECENGIDFELIELKEMGLGFYFDEGKLLSVFFHSSRKHPSYSKYAEPLPMGLSFEQSKTGILLKNGPPATEGGGREGYFGDVPAWIKYWVDGYTVHIEFSTCGEVITMVTLGLR